MTAAGTSAENRAMSSVFIGNIPYDVTEEQLKDLFSEVGAILNFRLFYDKSSGKSKGFAFCEYKEPEVAVSATRNLGGYQLKGQPLRVDVTTSEKCRQELERLQGSILESVSETPDSTTEKAPEEISKAVASLPAEQMFELMKQMKMCIENNPQEARNLLLQNPQLAYALLQAQVIMRIVDPEVAIKILDRPSGVTVPTGNLNPDVKQPEEQVPTAAPPMSEVSTTFVPGMPAVSADPVVAPTNVPIPRTIPAAHIRSAGERPPLMPAQMGSLLSNQFSDQDLRNLGDQDLRQLAALGDRDLRVPPMMIADKDMRQPVVDQDLRTLPPSAPENRPFDPRFRNIPAVEVNRSPIPNFDRPRAGNLDPRTAYEGRNMSGSARVEDPRKASMAALNNPRLTTAGPLPPNLNPTIPGIIPSHTSVPGAAEDQEKAALILQVLQLTDQQIAVLPPEQRQSIMVLKEQLARSQMP